jgi:RimJ/RimL family protein N-acetyltransferase
MALDLTGTDPTTVTVRTERLLLRPPVEADVDAIHPRLPGRRRPALAERAALAVHP